MTTKANINTHLMKEVEAACVVSLRVLWITLKKKKKKKSTWNTLMGLSELKEIIQMLKDINSD